MEQEWSGKLQEICAVGWTLSGTSLEFIESQEPGGCCLSDPLKWGFLLSVSSAGHG